MLSFPTHLPDPLQDLLPAHSTRRSPCQPWQGSGDSCVALGGLRVHPSEPLFSHLGKADTSLAGWLRSRWDKGGASRFGFKV